MFLIICEKAREKHYYGKHLQRQKNKNEEKKKILILVPSE